jgi:hypothetical protein
LQNGSSVGVQQRAQLQDDDGLAHAGEGVGGVNGHAVYILREQRCTLRNFHASRITRHMTHVTPVSIKCERRADQNGHDAFEHAEANGYLLRNGAGARLEG